MLRYKKSKSLKSGAKGWPMNDQLPCSMSGIITLNVTFPDIGVGSESRGLKPLRFLSAAILRSIGERRATN